MRMEEYTATGIRSSPLVGVDQLVFDPVYPSQGEDKHLANEKWPQYLVPESDAAHFPLANQDVTGANHAQADMYPYYAQPYRQSNDPSALTNPGQDADDFWALKPDSTQVLEEIEREGQKLRSRKHIW